MNHIHGFVALLDVLGFRSMVSGPSSAPDLGKYLAAVDEGIGAKEETHVVKFVIFSDSIIITTTDAEDESLRVLLRACSRLLGLFIEKEIAVRGAVAHGDFFREERANGVFVAGRPIVEAYEYERKQNWVGIVVTPSVLKAKPDLVEQCVMPHGSVVASSYAARLHWILLAQRYDAIPFHDGPFDGLAVVPTPEGMNTVGLSSYLLKCIQGLDTLKRLAGEPKAQKKYAETDRWLNIVRSGVDGMMAQSSFPGTVKYY